MTANGDDRNDAHRRLIIDSELCQGHGRCAAIVPDRIELDDLGYAVVTAAAVDSHDPEIARIKMAVDNCPERAVSLAGREFE